MRWARTVLIVVVALIAGPLLLYLAVRILGFSMFVLALPLTIFVLAWFVYRIWGKVYWRAWRISRMRNARYLREAVARGKADT